MTNPARAKLFQNGGSQAVRIPKDMRFSGVEVLVEKVDGGVLLRPVPVDQWAWLDELVALGPFSDDFIAAVNETMPAPDLKPEVAEFFGSKDR